MFFVINCLSDAFLYSADFFGETSADHCCHSLGEGLDRISGKDFMVKNLEETCIRKNEFPFNEAVVTLIDEPVPVAVEKEGYPCSVFNSRDFPHHSRCDCSADLVEVVILTALGKSGHDLVDPVRILEVSVE